MRRDKRYILKIYWEDDCTVECRYFPSEEDAMSYVFNNGISDYKIVKNK